jgi:hypothetical protein
MKKKGSKMRNLINVAIDDTRAVDLSFTRNVYFVHKTGTNQYLTGADVPKTTRTFSSARPFSTAQQARVFANQFNSDRITATDFEIYETDIKIAA